jgi:hypothetical protein
MPRVQVYQNSVNPSGPSEARLQPADFSSNIGAGLEAAGHGLSDIAQADVVKVEQGRELLRTQYTADLANMQGQLHGTILSLRDNAADGAAGHTDQVRTTLTDATQPFLAAIKDPILRREMNARVAGMSNALMTGETEWADEKRQASLGHNASRAIDTAANNLMTNPTPENLQQSRAALHGMINGWSGAPEALRTEYGQKADAATAMGYITGIGRNNPGQALAVLQSGLFDSSLSPEHRRTLETEMDTAQRQRVSAARSQAQAQINVLEGRLRNHDPTITDDEIAQAGQLAQTTGIPMEVFNLATARAMHQVDTQFRNSTPIEIRNAVGALNTRIGQAGDHASPDDVVKRDHLQTLLTQREAEMQHDPGAIVEQRGVSIPPLDGTPASIQGRVTAMHTVQQQTGTLQFYRPQEAEVLRAQAATGPNGRLAVINQVAQIGNYDTQMALAAAEQVAPGDRAFRLALRLGGGVRQQVVAGADARHLLPPRMNGEDGTPTNFDTASQAWFVAHVAPSLALSQPEFINEVLEGARNIYAERARRQGRSAAPDFNPTEMSLATSLALGATPVGGGLAGWTQGPRAADGNPNGFLLPTRMPVAEFEQRMANLPIARTHGQWPANSVPNGVPVDGRGQPISTDDIRQKFVPVAVSDGVYQFHRGNQVLMGSSGQPFQLNIRMIPPYHPNAPAGPHAASGVITRHLPVAQPQMRPALPTMQGSGSPDPTLSPEQYHALHPHG